MGTPLPAISIGPVPIVSSPDQVVRPIEQYVAKPQQIAELEAAAEKVSTRCMQKFGLPRFHTQLLGLDDAAFRDLRTHTRLYGFFDPSEVAVSGYNMTRTPPAEDGAPLSPEAEGVAFGRDTSGNPIRKFNGIPVPTGGCREVGIEAIGGSLPASDPATLPDHGPIVPLRDPRVAEGNAKWSACMKARGYDFKTPFDAAVSPIASPKRAAGQSVSHSAEEIAQAQADLACKISVNLVGIDLAVETAYDDAYIKSHTTALSQYRQSLDARLRTATQIIAANGITS
ncbi:hypothetical protein [Streptomyces sp. NPDC002676]